MPVREARRPENRADSLAGVESGDGADDVMDILQDLTLRETRTFSHGFASRLVGELDSVARLNKNPRREAGFRVLRAHDVPSVLVELGYLSSRKDLDLITSDEWRGKMVSSMTVAIDRFFATRLARQGARGFAIDSVWIAGSGVAIPRLRAGG